MKFIKEIGIDQNQWKTFWIGINDGKTEGRWVEDNTRPLIDVEYFNWAPSGEIFNYKKKSNNLRFDSQLFVYIGIGQLFI